MPTSFLLLPSATRGAATAAVLFIVFLMPLGAANAAPVVPALPQTFDVPYVAPTGRIINVAAGGDLQAALDGAERGDTLVLDAGATFTGSFKLPYKPTGTGWIYIQTSAYASLPPPGSRVLPAAHAAYMPKIVSSGRNEPAIRTASRASHYRFVGVEIRPQQGEFITNLVRIGEGEISADELPNHIVFDRVFVRGDPAVGGRRGFLADGRFFAIVDSHVSDFKEQGADSQAVAAYNTTGPLKVVNNFLEGAGENLILGGADPQIPDAVPTDVEIRGNLFYKPLNWLGERWTIKNSLELKTGRRVLIAGNTFQNNWAQAQTGFAIVFTPRNQDGRAPWTQITDVTFVRNRILNSARGVNILGTDDIHPSRRTERLLIQDNVLHLTALAADGTAQGTTNHAVRVFQILDGPTDLSIDHNTALVDAGVSRVFVAASGRTRAVRFVFTNNIVERGDYGFFGDAVGEGNPALGQYFESPVVSRNAIIGGSESLYPAGNFFPASRRDVRFANEASRDFTLAADSPYKGRGDGGSDIGARGDVARLPSVVTIPARPVSPRNITVQ
jgi:hypothetical protein